MFKKVTTTDILKNLQDRFQDDAIKTLAQIPSPELFCNMQKSVDRIISAITNRERITIVGDYDVDGVVASVILWEFFQYINYEIDFIIPNRFEDGYGFTISVLNKINCDLIITVDNGISSIEAANEAKKRGIDLIVTDHHTIPNELPDAYSIINPKLQECNFPEKDIAGATVAWYLVAGLKKSLNLDLDLKSFLDLMCFAILADAMPLRSINRIFVKTGLKELNKTKRPAILSIKKRYDIISFTSDIVAFRVNPRLNCAGRMEDATLAFEFLKAKTIQEADILLDTLDILNEQRKDIEQEIFLEAQNEVDINDDAIVIWSDKWHEGVSGIVASRLVDTFMKPAVVFCIDKDVAKASARSPDNVNLYQLIDLAKDEVIGFGGHRNAAGLKCFVEKLQSFKNIFLEAAKNSSKDDLDRFEHVLGELDLEHIDLDLLELIESFEPYGQASVKPMFAATNVVPIKVHQIGAQKDSLRVILKTRDHNRTINALWFRNVENINEGEKISFIYSLNRNSFRGVDEVQILIKSLI